MLSSPMRLALLTGLLVTSGLSTAYAAEPNTCSSSFYCYGSDATPAGATPVRVVVEGSNNQGTLIENIRRDVVTAPARPLPPVRTVVARPTNTSPVARPTNLSPLVNLASRPSILDANLPPATPIRRVIVQPTPRAQPTPRPTTIAATRPSRRVVASSSTSNSCDTLMTKASKAESQGVIFAKTGQSNLSRQSFQAAAGFRSQAKSLNCSV